MLAYKLFRLKKNGQITSLFINKSIELKLNEWLMAEDHETKGFKHRPFWHCTSKPYAPHLSNKGRVWMMVEILEYQSFKRPDNQGGVWYLANKIKIIGPVY